VQSRKPTCERRRREVLTFAFYLLPLALTLFLLSLCLVGKPCPPIPGLPTEDTAEAHFQLGRQFFESGNYPAAVKELSRAVELNSKLPQLQSYYGLALLNTGDPVAAEAAFRRELGENPNGYPANLGLGQILIVAGQYSEATPFVSAAQPSRIH